MTFREVPLKIGNWTTIELRCLDFFSYYLVLEKILKNHKEIKALYCSF